MSTIEENAKKLAEMGGASKQDIRQMSICLIQVKIMGGFVEPDNFVLLAERTPAVIQHIAKKAGCSVGELRNKISAGDLTSKEFFNLLAQDIEQ